MNNNFVPYLCGGILFSFLIELLNDTATSFHASFGNTKAITQPQIMENLIRVINPNYSYDTHAKCASFNKTVSNYRICNNNGGKIIPFERDTVKIEFDRCVKNQYGEVLDRMIKFTSECFPTCNVNAMRILVERTLILIRDDNSIENASPFFINEDGSSISKEELLKKEDFNFQSFLIGVWHYIITKPTKNKEGRQTFERLFPKYDGEKRKLDTQCLKPYAPKINVTWRKTSKESIPEKISENKDTVEPPKTGRNETLSVKIFYRGSLLDAEDEKKILSFSPAIIDLNKNPNTPIKNNPNSTIYKLTTEFRAKTHFISPNREIVRLYCHIGSLDISGTTSVERWAKSKIDEIRFKQKYPYTAWFKLTSCDEDYSAEFLMIGRIEE